jgi:hypothetical protein
MQNNLMKNDPLFSFEVVMIKISFNQKKKEKEKEKKGGRAYLLYFF